MYSGFTYIEPMESLGGRVGRLNADIQNFRGGSLVFRDKRIWLPAYKYEEVPEKTVPANTAPVHLYGGSMYSDYNA